MTLILRLPIAQKVAIRFRRKKFFIRCFAQVQTSLLDIFRFFLPWREVWVALDNRKVNQVESLESISQMCQLPYGCAGLFRLSPYR